MLKIFIIHEYNHAISRRGLRVFIGTKGKGWCARIKVHGVKMHLGYFMSEHNAATTYDLAAKKYFGEFARPNFESV